MLQTGDNFRLFTRKIPLGSAYYIEITDSDIISIMHKKVGKNYISWKPSSGYHAIKGLIGFFEEILKIEIDELWGGLTWGNVSSKQIFFAFDTCNRSFEIKESHIKAVEKYKDEYDDFYLQSLCLLRDIVKEFVNNL